MANEAHSGLAHCVRTRKAGARMVRAAHAAGVRRLAMEVLHDPAGSALGPVREIPVTVGGYLAQPDAEPDCYGFGAGLDLVGLRSGHPGGR